MPNEKEGWKVKKKSPENSKKCGKSIKKGWKIKKSKPKQKNRKSTVKVIFSEKGLCVQLCSFG